MTLEDAGRGLGWAGGILFLIVTVETMVRQWIYSRRQARYRREQQSAGTPRAYESHSMTSSGQVPRTIARPIAMLRMHTVTCQLCGKNTALQPMCEHPDAPTMDLNAPSPYIVERKPHEPGEP